MGASGYCQYALKVRTALPDFQPILFSKIKIYPRYARTQFADPNKDCDDWEKEVSNFYEDSEKV